MRCASIAYLMDGVAVWRSVSEKREGSSAVADTLEVEAVAVAVVAPIPFDILDVVHPNVGVICLVLRVAFGSADRALVPRPARRGRDATIVAA